MIRSAQSPTFLQIFPFLQCWFSFAQLATDTLLMPVNLPFKKEVTGQINLQITAIPADGWETEL